MSAAGRPPKPSAEHQKKGTYRADRHAGRAADAVPRLITIPAPPEYFTDGQRKKWTAICGMLKRDGMLADTYLELVERYCNCWQTWWKASQEVNKTGLTFSTEGGQIKQNPAVAIEKEMLSLMVRILNEFGYTPRSAMSIKVNPVKEDDDPAGFLDN